MCQHSDQSFLNKTLCTYSVCMDGKRLTAVKPDAENRGWDRSQTTAAPAACLALTCLGPECRMPVAWRGRSTHSPAGCVCPRLYPLGSSRRARAPPVSPGMTGHVGGRQQPPAQSSDPQQQAGQGCGRAQGSSAGEVGHVHKSAAEAGLP